MKNPPANAGDSGSASGFGRSPSKANGNPLHYSCLGNPMDRVVWQATVHVVRKQLQCQLREGSILKVFLAEAPILWPPDAKNWLIGKDPDDAKDWRQEDKGTTEDEIVGWHHRHESEQAPGVGDGQGGLACCSPWGHKESDTTEWLNCVPIIHLTL